MGRIFMPKTSFYQYKKTCLNSQLKGTTIPFMDYNVSGVTPLCDSSICINAIESKNSFWAVVL